MIISPFALWLNCSRIYWLFVFYETQLNQWWPQFLRGEYSSAYQRWPLLDPCELLSACILNCSAAFFSCPAEFFQLIKPEQIRLWLNLESVSAWDLDEFPQKSFSARPSNQDKLPFCPLCSANSNIGCLCFLSVSHWPECLHCVSTSGGASHFLLGLKFSCGIFTTFVAKPSWAPFPPPPHILITLSFPF